MNNMVILVCESRNHMSGSFKCQPMLHISLGDNEEPMKKAIRKGLPTYVTLKHWLKLARSNRYAYKDRPIYSPEISETSGKYSQHVCARQ